MTTTGSFSFEFWGVYLVWSACWNKHRKLHVSIFSLLPIVTSGALYKLTALLSGKEEPDHITLLLSTVPAGK